jgi:biopolymer transport protein ExbD
VSTVSDKGRKLASQINTSAFLAAPFASLFLLLVAMAPATHSASSGQLVLTTHPCAQGEEQIFYNRAVIIRLMHDGKAMLNSSQTTQEDLQAQLPLIFSTRPSRVLYLDADRDLPFQEVAAFLDTARAHTKHLHFAIISHEELGRIELPCVAWSRVKADLPPNPKPE